jgi:hypothetical protein
MVLYTSHFYLFILELSKFAIDFKISSSISVTLQGLGGERGEGCTFPVPLYLAAVVETISREVADPLT